jgi:hypothetical protein
VKSRDYKAGTMGVFLAQQIRDELKPGEHLLWSGYCLSRRGKQKKASGPMFGLIFGAAAGLIVGGFLSGAIGLSVPALIPLTAPLGALLGYRLLPPCSAYRKSRTIYALTDRRVFVLRDLYRNREVKSLPLQFIEDISVDERDLIRTGLDDETRAARRGTITFFTAPRRQRGVNDPFLKFIMTSQAQRIARMATEARRKLVAGNM